MFSSSCKLAEITSSAFQTSCGNVSLQEILGHGKYGVAFRAVQDGAPVAVKVYHHAPFYLVEDSAKQEYRKNVKIRLDFPELHAFLQNPISTLPLQSFGRVFVSELVANFDGSVSRSLDVSTTIPESFYDTLKRVLHNLAERPVLCRTVPSNILVKWINYREAIPVLIDFQTYAEYRRHPFLWLKHLTANARRAEMHAWQKRMLQSLPEFPEEWERDLSDHSLAT